MYQEILIQTIQKKLLPSVSIIDEISVVLSISYDASHRRVSLKSKFSIEETILLCKHYRISMDRIFNQQNQVLVEKTKEIKSFEDMVLYFEQSVSYLKKYSSKSDTAFLYPAKDIPLYYTIGGTLLSKFKLYVWLNLLQGIDQQESFDNFQPPVSLQEHSSYLKKIYDSVSVIEIWNDTTINSTIQQIIYFYESGLVSLSQALLLYDDVKQILHDAEKKCNAVNSKYQLYYNELLTLNNNVIVSCSEFKTLFVPYTVLGYFITEDSETCQNSYDYFMNQLKNSKSLNQSGVKDRKLFFRKAYQKVDFYIQSIQNQLEL